MQMVQQEVLRSRERRVEKETDGGEVWFVKEGQVVRGGKRRRWKARGLSDACDWQVVADLKPQLVFPEEICVTRLRPDIVIWSGATRQVILGELSVPWEENMEELHERKRGKYSELEAECREKGWRVSCQPFEVGCRGYIGNSFSAFLARLGVCGTERRRMCDKVAQVALKGSFWIWRKFMEARRTV